jgi:hypothetical protein
MGLVSHRTNAQATFSNAQPLFVIRFSPIFHHTHPLICPTLNHHFSRATLSLSCNKPCRRGIAPLSFAQCSQRQPTASTASHYLYPCASAHISGLCVECPPVPSVRLYFGVPPTQPQKLAPISVARQGYTSSFLRHSALRATKIVAVYPSGWVAAGHGGTGCRAFLFFGLKLF